MKDNDRWSTKLLAERPELASIFYVQKRRIWAEFMMHDIYSNKYWHPYVTEIFSDHQVYLLNEKQEPVAVGQSIPLHWDGTMANLPVGWNDCLVRAVADYEGGRTPNTLAALEIAIQPEYQGRGFSYRMINALRDLAAGQNYQAMIVAVRPSWKMRYPLTPMERYVRWQREDGAPFDPWLRVHKRSGGEILKVAHPSMIIEGSVDEWEEWTGMKFPESGDYIIPEALVPIQIDRAVNVGRYIEPNVWVHHSITSEMLGNTQPEDV